MAAAAKRRVCVVRRARTMHTEERACVLFPIFPRLSRIRYLSQEVLVRGDTDTCHDCDVL